jgi:hypothetical protein
MPTTCFQFVFLLFFGEGERVFLHDTHKTHHYVHTNNRQIFLFLFFFYVMNYSGMSQKGGRCYFYVGIHEIKQMEHEQFSEKVLIVVLKAKVGVKLIEMCVHKHWTSLLKNHK